MTSSAWWKNALKYLVAVALLALVLAMNWTALTTLLKQPPNLQPFLLAGFLLTVCTLIQYYRWYLLVRALDLPFTFFNAVRLGLVGTFYNTFLPGSIGGDFVKAYFIASGHPERKAAAIATVVADRMVGLFGLLLFSAAVGGGFWLAGDPKIAESRPLQTIILVCVGLAGTAVIGYFGLGFVPRSRADRFAERLFKVKKVGHTLAELWYTVWTYRQRPRTVLAVVGLSAIVHTGFVLIFHLSVRVFPPENPELLGTLPEHFVIIPIGFIVQALIPLPGGIGGGELTFGGLYKLIRGPEGQAVGLAGRLTMRLIEWTLGLTGYIVYLRMRTELPVKEAEDAADHDDYGDPQHMQ